MTSAPLRKENGYLRLAYNFRRLVHYRRVEKHGGRLAGRQTLVLRKELRVLHLDLQSAKATSIQTGCSLSF